MVLEFSIKNFKAKNNKAAIIRIIASIKSSTTTICQAEQVIQIIKKQLNQDVFQINIPSFTLTSVVWMRFVFYNQQQQIIDQKNTQLNELQAVIDGDFASFQIFLSQHNTNRQYVCTQLRLISHTLPNIKLPISNLNIFGVMKFRLNNGTYTSELVYNKLNDNILTIYSNNNDQPVYLEGILCLGDAEVIIISYKLQYIQLHNLTFNLEYLHEPQLMLIDLLLADQQNPQIQKAVKNLEIQKPYQKYFNNISQESFQRNNDILAQQLGKALNQLNVNTQIYSQYYGQLVQDQKLSLMLFCQQVQYITDTTNKNISHQITYGHLVDQHIVSFISFFKGNDDFDMIICQIKQLTDQSQSYPSVKINNIQMDTQPGVQNNDNIQLMQSQFKPMMIGFPLSKNAQALDLKFEYIPVAVKLTQEDIFNTKLRINFYKNQTFIEQHDFDIAELLSKNRDQKQFILGNGIICKQCQTQVADIYANQDDEKELDKILMSSNVEAFEYIQQQTQQQAQQNNIQNIVDYNNAAKQQIQQIANQFNDISIIQREAFPNKKSSRVNVLNDNKYKHFNDETLIDADTSILNLNNHNIVNREMKNFQQQRQINNMQAVMNSEQNFDNLTYEEAEALIQEYQKISMDQNNTIRQQQNQIKIHVDDTQRDNQIITEPAMTYEERQFIEKFLDKKGLFQNDKYIDCVCENFDKYGISTNLIRSILERYHLNQQKNLYMVDQVQINEETILQLEKMLEQVMQQQYNANEQSHIQLGRSYIEQKQQNFDHSVNLQQRDAQFSIMNQMNEQK